MEILLMLVTALGCAFIGWALIYFVSESPTALNTGRRPFAASALAAAPEALPRGASAVVRGDGSPRAGLRSPPARAASRGNKGSSAKLN